MAARRRGAGGFALVSGGLPTGTVRRVRGPGPAGGSRAGRVGPGGLRGGVRGWPGLEFLFEGPATRRARGGGIPVRLAAVAGASVGADDRSGSADSAGA